MKLLIRSAPSPKVIFNRFITGSFAVLLVCLIGTSLFFSTVFFKKESQRAEISRRQLSQALDFQHRLITEEMWTGSYDAIGIRIGNISKQFGNASYDVKLADEKGNCVYAISSAKLSTECKFPDVVASAIKNGNILSQDSAYALKFDESSRLYIYAIPLFVGAVHKGYLYTTFSDPYGFYRGNFFDPLLWLIMPTIAGILALWAAWLFTSRRYLLKPYLSGIVEMEKRQALGQLAAQIAHDIRSPLASLTGVVNSAKGISLQQKQLLISAESRITSLAKNLLNLYRDPNKERRDDTTSLVAVTISSIVAEKRAALGLESSIEILIDMDSVARQSAVALSNSDLSRILSNLLDNSIDALNGRPKPLVKISVKKNECFLDLSISDNGLGMSDETLSRIQSIGGSYGKSKGAGLGLQFSREVVATAGGSIDLKSVYGQGTEVSLKLPTASVPRWFANDLKFDLKKRVLILDDDESVHLLWKEKLRGYSVVHLRSSEEFDSNRFPKSEFIYLLDYELVGGHKTGIDVIREHDLGAAAILATSYFEDTDIQNEVFRLGSKILPKALIPLLDFSERSGDSSVAPGLMLIDDDPLIRSLWRVQARERNEEILCFENWKSVPLDGLSREMPVFIDYNLGEGITGAHVARELSKEGFRHLYYTTGYDRESLKDTGLVAGLVKAVYGKEYPGIPAGRA